MRGESIMKNDNRTSETGRSEQRRVGRYFGTDGFRGEANVTLTSMQAYKIGRFIGWYYSLPELKGSSTDAPSVKPRARVVIGKDTRRSSYMLEYAIAAGLAASGADAYMLHVITTPGVSYVTRQEDFDLGVMITASHNPFYDNGIKLINTYGEKLDDYTTSLVEDYLDGDLSELVSLGLLEEGAQDLPLAVGADIGRITDYLSGRNRYIGYLISLATHSFGRLKIALDCANGAAFTIAPAVFTALGARVEVVGKEPDGLNVNLECGSTHIERLCELVRSGGFDMGFAFDGDGDRCIAVDNAGEVVDGDKMMYILASGMKERGALGADVVVATVMSNGGLDDALKKQGISCIRTAVGDRFVYEKMKECDYHIGGEQSGHIIIKKYATTGDGILTAIMLTEEVIEKKSTLATLAAPVEVYPQYTVSVRVTDKAAVMNDDGVLSAVDEAKRLAGGGRVLVRASGTEPVVRIMTECRDEALCHECAAVVEEAMKRGGFVVG